MAKEPLQEESKEELKEEDLAERVEFTLDKEAFESPFICCNKQTTTRKKSLSVNGIEFTYEVRHCASCGKDYLDSTQGKRFDKIIMIQKMLDEKLITLERSVNFDGKAFFVRFPSEITKQWQKGSHAHIKVLSPDEYLVKVEA